MSVDIKYPEITVPLSELEGNAFFLIAATRKALRRHGIEAAEIEAFTEEAQSGDYDNVLQTIMRWVETS